MTKVYVVEECVRDGMILTLQVTEQRNILKKIGLMLLEYQIMKKQKKYTIVLYKNIYEAIKKD